MIRNKQYGTKKNLKSVSYLRQSSHISLQLELRVCRCLSPPALHLQSRLSLAILLWKNSSSSVRLMDDERQFPSLATESQQDVGLDYDRAVRTHTWLYI